MDDSSHLSAVLTLTLLTAAIESQPALAQVNNLQVLAPQGPARVIKQCFLFRGGRGKWGDLGAEPQLLGEFISWDTRPLSTTVFLLALLVSLQHPQHHGLQRQVRDGE